MGIIMFLVSESFRQTKIHNIGATVVGVDKFGNKYYEKLGDTQYGESFIFGYLQRSLFFCWIMHCSYLLFLSYIGRHRWVEYASKDRYNASQVPPEWHGWLHFITDHTGDEVKK